ncbi:MAG: TrkH family potassium uptake protein [Myxococcales bacterium]|nr:TrkH family potassium uptake protein [Myxococcales bacterium]
MSLLAKPSPKRGALFGVLNALGRLFVALAVLLCAHVPIAMLFGERPATLGFVLAAVVSGVLGAALWLVFPRERLGETPAMLLTGVAWIALSLAGSIPLVHALEVPFLDAYFETVSGFTTTGITLLTGLDGMPRTILLWRAMTQWVGGLGILTMFLLLTRDSPGAHALLGGEAHKIGAPRPEPGPLSTLWIIAMIYLGLTVAIALGLLLAGMSWFDAITHAMTTVSTGGFSTHDESIAYYARAGVGRPRAIEYVLIVGMLLSGTSFLVHYDLACGRLSGLWKRPETRWWWGLVLVAAGVLALGQLARAGAIAGPPELAAAGGGLEGGLRTIAFQVVAIATTTGFGTYDIAGPYFGAASQLLFLALMLVGGCVGSTAGGFKVLRVVLLARMMGHQLRKLLLPRGARAGVVYGGKLVDDDELERVAGLLFLWLALLLLGGLVTALLSDHGALASISGMFSALGNIGPCYIPLAELPALHPATKLLYIFGMLAGRLEILPIALLLVPRAWSR